MHPLAKVHVGADALTCPAERSSAQAPVAADAFVRPAKRSERSSLWRLTVPLLILTFCAPKAPAQASPIALKGAKLLTVTHGVIENGTVVMQGGKIIAVGAAASVTIPANAHVIDATGMTVYPGLIDSETALGLTEIGAENMTNDLVEMSDEIMPHMHTAEAFHAESALIPVARFNGITNAIV
ncbi:MAG: hypothetical protein ABR908_04175, partial [Terriglobales bacterium]